jgi:hypothetical protein
MTKRLIQDYAEVGMGGWRRSSPRPTSRTIKSNDRIRMGYLGDLPTVAEAAVYTELTKPTDEKISYVVQKRGGLLTISRRRSRTTTWARSRSSRIGSRAPRGAR